MNQMANESEYDGQYWDWFCEMLINSGCTPKQAKEVVDAMQESPKRTFGDLTVREVWETCHAHEHCKDCPFGNELCMAFLWHRPESVLDAEVNL